MKFLVVGIDYKSCPLQMRELLTFTSSQIVEILKYLKTKQMNEVVILSTCHRTEFYITQTEQIDFIVQFICVIFQKKQGKGDIRPYFVIHKGEAAIKHLFNVASGLESLVLGEDQILGQVKHAVELANEAGTLGKITHKVFREAITTSKKIKNQIKISEYPLSISHIAIQFLKEKRGELKHSKGLLIGLGQMNELAIKYLLEEDIDTLYVTNRTHGRALQIKALYEELVPIPYEERYTVLNQVDFVISATASPHVVLKLEEIPQLTKQVFFIDIAVPFDIDKRIGKLPLAKLYTMEDLETIASRNQKIREHLSEVATIEINKSISQLYNWLDNLEVEEAASVLNQYCNVVKEHTLHVIKHHVHEDIPDNLIDYMLTEALRRFVRKPIAHLRSVSDKEERKKELEVLKTLFDLSYKER